MKSPPLAAQGCCAALSRAMFLLVHVFFGRPDLSRIWSSMTVASFQYFMIFRIAPQLIEVPKCFLNSIKHYLYDETFNTLFDCELSLTKWEASHLSYNGDTGRDVGSHFYHNIRSPPSLGRVWTLNWSIICRLVIVSFSYHLWFGCYNDFAQHTFFGHPYTRYV